MNVFTIYPAPCAFLRAAGRRVAATARMPPKADSSVGVRCLSGGVYPRPTAHAPPRSWQTPRLCAYTRPLGVFHGRRSLFSSSKVIRNYEDLPRDYRDQAGLQFGARELSEEEIGRIFGAGLTAAAGNRLLRILHGRRVAGTLDDPAFAAHTAQFPEALIARGLEYLRQEVPVNEVMNAGLRAEDELNQMDRDVEERESQERAASASGDRIEGEGEDAGPEADPVYGRGAFDRIRARNIAKQKAKDKIAEEERLAREAEEQVGVSGPPGPARRRQPGHHQPQSGRVLRKGPVGPGGAAGDEDVGARAPVGDGRRAGAGLHGGRGHGVRGAHAAVPAAARRFHGPRHRRHLDRPQCPRLPGLARAAAVVPVQQVHDLCRGHGQAADPVHRRLLPHQAEPHAGQHGAAVVHRHGAARGARPRRLPHAVPGLRSGGLPRQPGHVHAEGVVDGDVAGGVGRDPGPVLGVLLGAQDRRLQGVGTAAGRGPRHRVPGPDGGAAVGGVWEDQDAQGGYRVAPVGDGGRHSGH
ncbi:hypothetical protein J3458_003026 [Metarhizium acridum]|uniref:uncharacterized protein n=1 Tax=Metarhizium acridum TaxID=92637 RepID=UPI001C6AF623|nr:hypothetical protein J3458_003026 [Metarhizium acridum]